MITVFMLGYMQSEFGAHIGQDAALQTLLNLKTGASNLESALSVSKRIQHVT
jgi:hypothetical protein